MTNLRTGSGNSHLQIIGHIRSIVSLLRLTWPIEALLMRRSAKPSGGRMTFSADCDNCGGRLLPNNGEDSEPCDCDDPVIFVDFDSAEA